MKKLLLLIISTLVYFGIFCGILYFIKQPDYIECSIFMTSCFVCGMLYWNVVAPNNKKRKKGKK